MQSQFMALTTVEGRSTVIETVFENRYMHISELNRMGADISIEGRSAVVQGGASLSGCQVMSTDLRAELRWCWRAWLRKASQRSPKFTISSADILNLWRN